MAAPEKAHSETSHEEKVASPVVAARTDRHHALTHEEILAAGNVDKAALALEGQDRTFTKEEEDRVRRKIDLALMPLLSVACGMQLVDKQGLGTMAVYGLRTALNFQGTDYSWAVSIFYFGYLAGSAVQGRGLQYFHSGKWIGACYFLWGTTLGMIGAQNFATVAALRFLLGLLESTFYAGVTLVVAGWYRQHEQASRFGLWTLLNGALPIPFYAIYWAVGQAAGPLEPFRYIPLILGLISCTIGILLFLFLAESPLDVRWLTPREKMIAVERVAANRSGLKNTEFKWYQVREAFTDIRVWLVVSQMFFSQALGNITTNFLGLIITGLGYTALQAQLLQAPNFAVATAITLVITFPPTYIYACRNYKQVISAIASIGGILGAAILYAAEPTPSNNQLRLFGVIAISFNAAALTQVFCIVGANFAGYTKRATASSMVITAYCVINIVTPQTFLNRESPRYRTGIGFCLGCACVYVVVSFIGHYAMQRENKRRDRLAETDPTYSTVADDDALDGLRDLTDRENMRYRFSS